MKKYILTLVACLVLLSIMPVLALAQTASTNQTQDQQPQNPAEIYVRSLQLTEKGASAGNNVYGSFFLVNGGTEPVSNVFYHVLLIKDDPTIGQRVYDDQSFGPMDVAGAQGSQVKLAYKVPPGVSGQMTLRVRATLGSGFKMGWADAPIVVSGPVAQDTFSVVSANVVVNGANYASEEGPTVYATDTASYLITLKNEGKELATVTPSVSFYKKDVTGTPVLTTNGDAVAIAPGKSADISIPLPKNFPADSYEAKVEIKNSTGLNVVPLMSFRYIIAGNILTIQSVTVDPKTLAGKENISVQFSYTGTPIDLSGRSSGDIGSADISVTLKNETGAMVAESNTTETFDAAGGTKNVQLTSTGSARGLSLLIIVTKNGTELARYESTISKAPAQNGLPIRTLAIVIGSVVVLIALGIVIWRKSRRPEVPMAVLILAASFLFFGGAHTASAFTVTDSFTVSRTIFSSQTWVPNVFINTPYGSMLPNTQFYIDGDVEILACHNKPSYVSYEITRPLPSGTTPTDSDWVTMGTLNRGSDNVSEHYSYLYDDTFRCGDPGASGKCVSMTDGGNPGAQIQAPATPGTYRVYFRILNDPKIGSTTVDPTDPAVYTHTPLKTDAQDHDLNYGWVTGYQEFTVTAPPTPPTVNLGANPLKITAGQSSNLTWTTFNMQTGGTCVATNDESNSNWTGNKAFNGTNFSVANISTNTKFTITCTNPDGLPASDSVVVQTVVAATPSVSLIANPVMLPPGGGNTNLTWATANATSCTVSNTMLGGGSNGNWTGNVTKYGPVAGGVKNIGMVTQTTFTISCNNNGGPAVTDSVTVYIAPQSYDAVSDIKIERVGPDGTAATAPANTQARLGVSWWNTAGECINCSSDDYVDYQDFSFANEGSQWRFGDNNQPEIGTVVVDSTGNVPNANLAGNVQRTSDTNPTLTFASDNSTSNPTGGDQWINMGGEVLKAVPTNGTISLWVKWNGQQPTTSGYSGALNIWGPLTEGPIIGLDGDNSSGNAHVVWRPFSPTVNVLTSTSPVGNGVWHNIIITYTPTVHKMYMDGVLQGTYTYSGPQQIDPTADSNDMTFGHIPEPLGGGCNYNICTRATVDEFRIYPRVVTDTEITELSQSSSRTETSPNPGYPDPWVSANPALYQDQAAPVAWGYLNDNPNTPMTEKYNPSAENYDYYSDTSTYTDSYGDVWNTWGVTNHDYAAFVTPVDIENYDIMAGSCTYPRSGTNCTVTSYTITPTCNTQYCYVPISMLSDQSADPRNTDPTDGSIVGYYDYTTKVSFKFTPKSPPPVKCNIVVNGGAGWSIDYFNYPNAWEGYFTAGGTAWPFPWSGNNNTNGIPRGPLEAGWTNQFSQTNPYFVTANNIPKHLPDLQLLNRSFPNPPGVNVPPMTAFAPFGLYDNSYGMHISGTVSTTTYGTYGYKFYADEGSWIYFDHDPSNVQYGGNMVGNVTFSPAQKSHQVDIYYANKGVNGNFGFAFDVDNKDGNLATPQCVQIARTLLVRRVGPDGDEADAPDGTISIDGGTPVTGTLQTAGGLTIGPHTASVTDGSAGNPPYSVTVGTCQYAATSLSECDIPSFTAALCASGSCTTATPPTVADGYITKVVFKYNQPPTTGININANPPHGANPVAVQIKNSFNVNWTETGATSCTISNGTNSQDITSQLGAGSGSISDTITNCSGTCNITYTLSCINSNGSSSDQVVAQVSSGTHVGNDLACYATVVNPNTGDVVPASQAAVGQPITWQVEPPYNTGSYTYAWKFDGAGDAISTPSRVKTYSTLGQKTTTVTVTGTDGSPQTVTCYANTMVSGGGTRLLLPTVLVTPAWGQF